MCEQVASGVAEAPQLVTVWVVQLNLFYALSAETFLSAKHSLAPVGLSLTSAKLSQGKRFGLRTGPFKDTVAAGRCAHLRYAFDGCPWGVISETVRFF